MPVLPRANLPTISRRIREARERIGLPQDRLGVLAGLDESSSSARISRYEGGVHEPPVKFAEKLALVLNVPMAYLYCSDDRLAEIILAYGRMTDAERDELVTMCRRTAATK